MEESFSKWRPPKGKVEEIIDSDDSDYVYSPPPSQINSKRTALESDDEIDFQRFSKTTNIQSSTRIEQSTYEINNSDNEEDKPSTSVSDEEETSESEDEPHTDSDEDNENSVGSKALKNLSNPLVIDDSDSRASSSDKRMSSVKLLPKLVQKNDPTDPVIADKSDGENGDSDDSFKIVRKKKVLKNRVIDSDSETEDLCVSKDSISQTNYRKKESVPKNTSRHSSGPISSNENSNHSISCSSLNKKDTSTSKDSKSRGSITSNSSSSISRSPSSSNEKQTSKTKNSSHLVNQTSNSSSNFIEESKIKDSNGHISWSSNSRTGRKEESIIERSTSKKLEVNLEKSIEEMRISDTSLNKKNASEKDASIIIIDSDSEVNYKLPVESKGVVQNEFDVPKKNIQMDIEDRIRVQQLLAEQKRLQIQIDKSKDELAKCKATLRTANLSALPDRGMRLQLNLERQVANIRDLLFQQKKVDERLQQEPNEVIAHLKSNQIQQPQQYQPPQWSKFASAAVNINEMGKKALETHRTQQALTMDALQRLHNSLVSCPKEDAQAEDPKGLTVTLMPHQKHALAWLLWREREKPRGGILADDMGLGKTLTMISLILKAEEEKISHSESEEKENEDSGEEEGRKESKSNWLSSSSDKIHKGKTLVVCPASLIGQWEREVKTKVKDNLLRVEMYHGQNRMKKESRLARRDIVITTYTIVARECGEIKPKKDGGTSTSSDGPLFNIRWERIILDEAHTIRNHKNQTSLAVFKLKATYRWTLTGTPIHNKELDLYALLKFIRCSPFDDLGVWKRWVDNRDAAGNQRLSTMIKALMLRRTKEDLQKQGSLTSLQAKKFSTIEVQLTKEEFELYQKILDFSKTLLAQFIEHKAEKEQYYGHMPIITKKASRYKYDAVEDAFADNPDLARLHSRMRNMSDVKTTDILVLLLRLRQICCHPCLIKAMLNKEEVMNVGIEDNEGLDMALLEKMGDMTLVDDNENNEGYGATKMSALNPQNPIFSPDRLSSKIKAVLKTVEECVLQTTDKAIIVSQWTSMLELVYSFLKRKNIKCVVLTGSVPVKDRGSIVDNFNRKEHGPKIMLLSLTAGGVGLNLVGANHLLMIDLHWNPQLEAQACDRIYRVGQEKQVHIYKFVCVETIEERIQKLQEKKLALAQNVLTGSNLAQASKLTLDDLKMLFNMK